MNHKPQILAPAGGQAQIDAAIHAGADAVYFGLQSSFNARARAIGIPPSELETVMQQLHRHGVEGYLALNTLVFDEELEEVEKHIRLAACCGVDALIVQDIGVIQLARHIAPHLPLHGSTQMSITDAEGVAFAESLGIERIVVGRELSIDEISQIEAKTSIEIEAFVHGALCVSYSGQCFSSEAWGGRSANRGQCAQACRLPYGLLVDGKVQQQGDMNYLLSPQDLMALGQVPQLIEAGVSCFKIEGRLKGPEYVLSTISAYREAVDRAWDAHLSQNPLKDTEPSQEQRRRLAQVFSRGQGKHADGLTPGFLHGPHHQELVIGRNPRHRGLYLGTVSKITDQGVELTLNNPVKAGDGVVFDSGDPQGKEAGGNVFTLLRKGKAITEEVDSGEVTLTFAKHVRLDHVHAGDIVWRTKDTRMDSGPNLSRETRLGGLSTDIHISLVIGKPIAIELSSHRHHLKYESETLVQAAQNRALDEASVTKAIGSLGDTSLELNQLTIALDNNCFVPVSQLKQARRDAVETFSKQIITHQRDKDLSERSVLNNLLLTTEPIKKINPELSLLCRTQAQVHAALKIDWLSTIIVDVLEVHGLKDACEAVKEKGRILVVAAPRIFKPGEERLVRYLLKLEADALLIRSTGLLWQLTHSEKTQILLEEEKMALPELWGDFSLNASNQLTAHQLIDLGLSRLALTHDVNAEQIAALAENLPQAYRDKLELIAHHHLPIFHTEHCVFARFMSHGNSYKDCGRPCEHHTVHLRDPGLHDHLVLADIGCRNTVFNAQAQSAATYSDRLIKAGISHWRIELVDEPAEEVEKVVTGYQQLLDGTLDSKALWKTLGNITDANHIAQGVSLGSLAVRAEQTRSQMKKPTAR